jgi:cobalamin-dependent methionine synthase I
VAQAMGSAKQIAVAVCTIGPQLEEAVGAMFTAGQQVEATVLDGVGSAAVEELAQRACRMFEDMARQRGLMTSSPLSPGEPDWPLEGQRELFDLVPGEEIGVTLTDTFLMRPLKSLSLVVGIGENLSTGGSPCEFCSLNQVCRYRERKA